MTLAGLARRPHAFGMLVALLPLLVALVGVLMFALATNGKVQSIGLAMFTGGVTGICVAMASRLVRIL